MTDALLERLLHPVYNLCLSLLLLIALPKLLWQWWRHGKYRGNISARLGFSLPKFSPKKGQTLIWIHSVSMGETKAIIPLFDKMRQFYPDAAIVISTTTETGQALAKRSMPKADAHFFLPLDFSWSIRRILNQIQPSLLILCESDFWYHLLKMAKDRGVRIALVNGKISERSCRRFQKIPFFTRRLFANFDLFCLQSELYRTRFISLNIPPDKIHVTGNLKFDSGKPSNSLCKDLGSFQGQVLVIGSTHAKEEDWFLSALDHVWKKIPDLQVFLVPRHPERFNEVAQLITKHGFPFSRLSEEGKSHERLILVDCMGKLNACYQIATIAIVGGSFTPEVGGHNIFEPVFFGVPVLFGPYMHNQSDLKELVLSANAGKEVRIDHLPEAVIEILENPEIHQKYVTACHSIATSVQGATERVLKEIAKL